MSKRISSLSLRWKLSFLIGLVAILTSTAISIAVYDLWSEQIKNQIGQQLDQNTLLATKSLQHRVHNENENLSTWSQLDVMVDIITDDVDKRIINTIKLLKKNHHLPGDIYILNYQKKIVATTANKTIEFASLNQNIILPDSSNLLSHAFIQLPIIINILPEEITGYIILTHPWNDMVLQLSEFLQEFLIVQNENKNYYFQGELQTNNLSNEIELIDSQWTLNGQTKLHSKINSLLVNENKSLSIYGIVNKSKALEPVEDTLLMIAAITLALLIPIGFISIWGSTNFVKPIIELQQFAESIAQTGDLKTDFPIHTNDEVGRLAKVLKRMTLNLKDSFEENKKTNKELKLLTENLEIRVDERTQELSKALSKLKQAQSQLVQSEKMVGLGQLVAGIAHELNNPISSIYANIPALTDYLTDLIETINKLTAQEDIKISELKIWLEEIDFDFMKEDVFSLLQGQKDSAKRIRDIVLSLRNFSRLDESEIKYSNINEGIDSTLNILRHQIKNRITVHKDYQLSKDIECFPGEINQVIMNILANASQAITGDGNIWILTKQLDDYSVKVEIKDDGPGIPETILGKIFDPFFTTKGVGEGTGLGLSISYGIIDKHHGKINIRNDTTNGAIFSIILPISQDKYR